MKEIFKNSLIYSVARIVPGITGFILLPIYTDYLVPSEYGKFQSMQTLSMFLVILFSLASERAIFRLYYDYDEEIGRKKLIGNIFFLIVLSTAFFGGLTLFFDDYTGLIFQSIDFYPFYTYTIFFSILTSYSFIPLNLLQVNGKALKFTIYSTGSFLLTTALILYYVLYRLEGVVGILKGQLYASLFMMIFYLIEIYKNATLKIDIGIIKNILSFSIPFIPVVLGAWILNMSNRVLLDVLIVNPEDALSEIGIYSFAYKISSLSLIIMGAIYTAYNPIFYKEAKINNINSRYKLKKIKFVYVSIAGFFCIIIPFFSRELLTIIFSVKYYEALYLIPIFTFGFFLTQIISMYNLMIYQEKNVKSVMYNLIISSTVTVVASLFLVSVFWSKGAAVGSLIGLLTNTYLQYKTALKYYYVDFNLKQILLLMLPILLLILYDLNYNTTDAYVSLIIKIGVLVIVFIIFYKKIKEIIISFFS